jgi:hypothetical protein
MVRGQLHGRQIRGAGNNVSIDTPPAAVRWRAVAELAGVRRCALLRPACSSNDGHLVALSRQLQGRLWSQEAGGGSH